jgi:hypothetical protein
MKSHQNTILMRREKHSAANAFACAVYSALGGSKAAEALDLFERNDLKSLVSLEVNPSDYNDIDDFRDDYLACELMSKFPSWDIGINREKVALEKFSVAEQACASTSVRLASSYGVASTTTSYASMLYSARRKIERCLGPFDWDQAALFFGWGPGATTQLPRVRGDAYYKFGLIKPDVTRECAVLAACAIAQSPIWYMHVAGLDREAVFCIPSPELIARDHLNMVDGNRITTVPKNAKTDRCIAIEPTMNMYIQKGIGGFIRRRLRRVGIDLNSQSLNQRLAKEGSVSGQLCTVDLSAASDSISLRLVEELLPSDWVTAIKLCRSSVGVMPDGSKVSYHKVSSMGNGFTFELESLIFWALCSVVADSYPCSGERQISVYGDDLIFPTSLYSHTVGLLEFCGFSVNSKKSFCYGYFRESCGKHYFNGFDVSPFYVREDIDNQARLIWAANQVRRYSHQRYPFCLDGRFRRAYNLVHRLIKPVFKTNIIPDGYGDGSLIGDLDEANPRRDPSGRDGWICSTYVPVPKKRRVTGLSHVDYSLLLKSLWGISKREEDGSSQNCMSDILLSESNRYKQIKLFVPQWVSFGPWLDA